MNENFCPICQCPLFKVGERRPYTRERFLMQRNGHIHDPNIYATLHVCDNGHEVEDCCMLACEEPKCKYRGDRWVLVPYTDTYPATVLL